jgi:hypothetical protein
MRREPVNLHILLLLPILPHLHPLDQLLLQVVTFSSVVTTAIVVITEEIAALVLSKELLDQQDFIGPGAVVTLVVISTIVTFAQLVQLMGWLGRLHLLTIVRPLLLLQFQNKY